MMECTVMFITFILQTMQVKTHPWSMNYVTGPQYAHVTLHQLRTQNPLIINYQEPAVLILKHKVVLLLIRAKVDIVNSNLTSQTNTHTHKYVPTNVFKNPLFSGAATELHSKRLKIQVQPCALLSYTKRRLFQSVLRFVNVLPPLL